MVRQSPSILMITGLTEMMIGQESIGDVESEQEQNECCVLYTLDYADEGVLVWSESRSIGLY